MVFFKSLNLYKKILGDFSDYLFGSNCYQCCDYSDSILYPIDLEFTLLNKNYYYKPLDKDGIPVVDYVSVGQQYNPTRIAAYGLANYNRWVMSKNLLAKDEFFKIAHWFLNNDRARYEYDFNWGELSSPWISCIAQGEAVSVLIRAYRLTNDVQYIKKARLALEPFLDTVENDGLQSYINDCWVFFEEYPVKKPDHVLNGFLYALIGLIEYCSVVLSDKTMIDLRDKCIQSLLNNIDHWGQGSWSFYQIPCANGHKNYCTPKYHNLQISQLTFIASKFGLLELYPVIERWKKGRETLYIRLYAMFYKVLFRLIFKAQR